ncbi:MAG: protein kinase [Gemmatimonadetes bacterium]|nr:protein kinase [Gemmatimonadota bacterium]
MTDHLLDRVTAAVGDRYLIEGELGRGGMAVVYRATDLRLHRSVAIKVLPPELAFNSDVKTRFLREAQMAAGLQHPNVVPIFSVDEQEGIVFFVMALVEGESLAARLTRDPRRPIDEVRRIIADVADALSYAHERGVVHRDIKPDNILIDQKSGRVMVTDFGIARAAAGDSRLTVTGVAVGTPTYMSPEQALGERDIDGRSDVYSLGVVGYQMLAGEPPFKASNTPAMLVKHVSETPRPLSGLRNDAPPGLVGAIAKSMAKKPEDRWESAAVFRDAVLGKIDASTASAPAPLPRANWMQSQPMAPMAPLPLSQSLSELVGRPLMDMPMMPPMPAFPIGADRNSDSRQRWREAQRAWRDQVREQRAERKIDRSIERYERKYEMQEKPEKPLSKQIAAFQGHLWSNLPVMVGLWVINLSTSHFPWAIFPTVGMGMGLLGHFGRLRSKGVSTAQIFRWGHPTLDPNGRVLGPTAPPVEQVALASSSVLAGPHGATVRRAMENRATIEEVLRSLTKDERARIPEVPVIVKRLAETVAAIATTLHQLDTDVAGSNVDTLVSRAAALKLEPQTQEIERRIQLLERQVASLADLQQRTRTLRAQLESSSIALENLKLDMLKLRSVGIDAAYGDVNSATQEARAVSRDIGYVLDAAAEVRKL